MSLKQSASTDAPPDSSSPLIAPSEVTAHLMSNPKNPKCPPPGSRDTEMTVPPIKPGDSEATDSLGSPSDEIEPDTTAPANTGSSKTDRSVHDALQHMDIGIDKDERPFAVIKEHGNPIAYPLHGKKIKQFLRKRASKLGFLLKKDDISDVIENLDAHAAVNENHMDVYLRIAPSEQNGREIDLGTADNKRISLEDGKATLISSGSTVLFTRSEIMQPMPVPTEAGSWNALLPHLNMDEKYKLLLIGWMTYVITHYKGQSAYPLLVIKGEQGSGKSLLSKHILRPLVDNNSCGLQMFPTDAKDLVISSQNQHVLIYDNIRFLSKKWSDTLCIAATSGSMATRKLYTDAEESVMHVHAPIVLNGIHNFIVEPDLASRCLTIQLDRITPNNRKDESRLIEEIENDAPAIFRGLLDLSAKLLEVEGSVQSANLSRLTDFCRWLAAMEQVLELDTCQLQMAYQENLSEAMLDTIQDNPLAAALLSFAEQLPGGAWKGTPTQLLQHLAGATCPDLAFSSNGLPKNAIALSKQLKSIEKLLDSQGVSIEFGRDKDRYITINFEGESDEY
jgi:hypothetical protein